MISAAGEMDTAAPFRVDLGINSSIPIVSKYETDPCTSDKMEFAVKTRKVLKERLNGTNNILIVICLFASRAKQQANDKEMSFGMSTGEIPPLSKKIFLPK